MKRQIKLWNVSAAHQELLHFWFKLIQFLLSFISTFFLCVFVVDSGGDEHAQSIKKDIIKRYKSAKARSDAEGNSSGEPSPPTKRKAKKGKKKR